MKILKKTLEYIISGFLSTVFFILFGIGLGYIAYLNLDNIILKITSLLGI